MELFPKAWTTDKRIIALLGLASVSLLVLLVTVPASEATRASVMAYSVITVIAALKWPRIAGGIFTFILLMLSFEPNTRNVVTAICSCVVIVVIAQAGRTLAAILFAIVFVYLGSSDIFHGELVPASVEGVTLLSAIFLGMVGAGAWVGSVQRRSQEEKRRAELAARLERDALIMVLHDSVARALTSSIMRLEGVRGNLNLTEQESDELAAVSESNRTAMGQVRDLLRVLHDESLPQMPVESPLAEQIDYFTQLLESHGFAVTVYKDESIPKRQYERDLVSLPIMAELAANILKYGNPSGEVDVSIRKDGKGTLVTVSNHIAKDTTPRYLSTGLGLRKIQKEVENAGGSFKGVEEAGIWRTRWFLPGK